MSSNSLRKTSTSPQYTCADEIRRKTTAGIAIKAAALKTKAQGGEEMIESWVRIASEKAASNGTLMTSRQYTDWAMGRSLSPGDACTFIGESREEVTIDDARSMRMQGQTGHVTSVDADKAGDIITFVPNEPVDVTMANGSVKQSIVPLTVRQYTRGWLELERVA